MVSSCLLCELISLKCFCLIVSVEISSWLQLHWHYWSESRTRAPSSSASPSDRSFDEWRHRISNNSEKKFQPNKENFVVFLTINKMFSANLIICWATLVSNQGAKQFLRACPIIGIFQTKGYRPSHFFARRVVFSTGIIFDNDIFLTFFNMFLPFSDTIMVEDKYDLWVCLSGAM